MPFDVNKISLQWLTVLFVTLAATFWFDMWERPANLHAAVPADSSFADPATVRLSAAELMRTDGDVSMLECYSCHDPESPPVLELDEEGNMIWEEHRVDFDLQHGSKHRNEYCFTCHASDNMEKLKTPDGRYLGPEESTVLCGSCHGTTLRDWEVNIHGRVNGYWNLELGEAKRQDCTSCHDPHSPAFQSMEPAPGPQPLRSAAGLHHPAADSLEQEESEELDPTEGDE